MVIHRCSLAMIGQDFLLVIHMFSFDIEESIVQTRVYAVLSSV